MRLLRLMISIAAGVCVLAACSARAGFIPFVTNAVTFSVMTFNQGSTNTTTSGINTITNYGRAHTISYNTAGLLHEIGKAITTNGFTSGAKLVLITGNGPRFAVVDGTNFYDLSSSGSNIMSSTFTGIDLRSGSINDTTGQEKFTTTFQVTVVYDDTADTGGTLTFTLNGLFTLTTTRTALISGTYTETVNGKYSSLKGGGTSNGNPFTATGSISFTGKATF